MTDHQCELLFGLNLEKWKAFKANALQESSGNRIAAAASILSDAQFAIETMSPEGLREIARIRINQAKAIMVGGNEK